MDIKDISEIITEDININNGLIFEWSLDEIANKAEEMGLWGRGTPNFNATIKRIYYIIARMTPDVKSNRNEEQLVDAIKNALRSRPSGDREAIPRDGILRDLGGSGHKGLVFRQAVKAGSMDLLGNS